MYQVSSEAGFVSGWMPFRDLLRSVRCEPGQCISGPFRVLAPGVIVGSKAVLIRKLVSR